jgi:hypothetical protein
MQTRADWTRRVARRRDDLARRITHELVSKHTRFRGAPPKLDGSTTLVTVNFGSSDEVRRLVRSFRRYCPGEQVVVVENGPRERAVRVVADHYLSVGANLHHGLGLDVGMRAVTSEWTLVCDPDSAILSSEFLPSMKRLAARGKGVAGIETAHAIYHPICVLFRTEIWKGGGFSFKERWPWWDVGGELTALVGGRSAETLLARTRVAGPRFGYPIFLVEVYEDLFTNTYLGSRIRTDESDELLGMPRSVVLPVHTEWKHWVDGVLDGSSVPSDFPFQAATP